MATEKTFILIKPDGIQRRKVGTIFQRLEQKGLKLVGLKMMAMSPELASQQYAEHREKPFYDKLICFITSGPVIASVWQGGNAVKIVRRILGQTDPLEALPGTIRGDFALNTTYNLVHASDSSDTAGREINIFFDSGELQEYDLSNNDWIQPPAE